MKSIRTNPRNGADEGDERIRTAEQGLGTDPAYGMPEHVWDRRSPSGVWLVGCTDSELARVLLSGEWTTHEVHEAARRLLSRGGAC